VSGTCSGIPENEERALYMRTAISLLLFGSALLIAILAIYSTDSPTVQAILNISKEYFSSNHRMTTAAATNAAKSTMSKALKHATIVPCRSSQRGHSDHGWLNSYHTFSFAGYQSSGPDDWGSLRVLNEDRVQAQTGFPTHPHRDAEIFSYILSGELTHRDSMIKKGAEGGKQGKDFYRMKRGDVQFTTGGTGKDSFLSLQFFFLNDIYANTQIKKGIAHSEENEHATDTVHFLQIWAYPWKRSLMPNYHTRTFDEDKKRQAFLPILSPLAAGPNASPTEEKEAVPKLPGTIPIHADLVMGAGIVGVDKRFKWTIGGPQDDVVRGKYDRKVYVHLPMTKDGNARIRLDGRENAVLSEGDGAFVSGVNVGDVLSVESIGEAEAEVIVLDSE
jgi:hypothetical protein